MANTFDDYILAVRSKYEVEKNSLYSDFLLKSSPAQIRELCLLIYDKGLSNKDNEVFELFFKTKPDSTLRKAIENIDVERLKKICNFLNGKSKSTSQNTLNLIAILVNYELRPFSFFLKSHFDENDEVKIVSESENTNSTFVSKQEFKNLVPSVNIKKRIVFGLLLLVGIISIGYTARNILAPEQQCMQWQKNHYKKVDCDKVNQYSLLKQNDIVPFDEDQSRLVKIEVSDTTVFFKNDKPLYWYCKVNGKPEFFNTHGIHPVTGKALKPVTNYIIEKYVK